MTAPSFSTITLLTEIVVTISILYVFRTAYARNRFPGVLVAGTLAYETLVNIGYMISRMGIHAASAEERPVVIALAAFHGIFSLVMFIGLLGFMAVAWKAYGKGVNYFRVHRTLTAVFIVLWLVAVASGFLFYAVEYLA